LSIIMLCRRIYEAQKPFPAGSSTLKPLWPLNGKVHPNACPAIKDANMKGVLLSSPMELSFDGPDTFDVHLCHGAEPEILVYPGVIGTPESRIRFAKVDTGLSVNGLPFECLSLPVLNLEFSLELIIPGIIYPVGYCGPLFIAVAARTEVRIPAGYPLTQLVAMNGQKFEVELTETLSYSRNDHRFEGLLRPGWDIWKRKGKTVKAHEFLELLRDYSEDELGRVLFEDWPS
jgi:hypothetical protein